MTDFDSDDSDPPMSTVRSLHNHDEKFVKLHKRHEKIYGPI